MENTLVEILDQLRKEGYTEDFNLKKDCLECINGQYQIFHDEFQVDKIFRFEGDSNPSDEAILYAISSEKYKLKGVLVNAFGVYAEPLTNEMITKLKQTQI
ncbi:phosphoribosylpyrophosphate synthetase [Thermoflexibacter ruber]|uniref:Phosphoribosylpyrophosphate synthetase n=1 Tax=Thermoflexibacter ruber TaxID=1003 RepID=A0A1I2CUD6_9BACT|nr:phosphoribosylpyrophosphate synthetase [Thermoflexibacter ruber]SFE71868.1 hypothetical protein SAMN04488541_1005156 [Thermoflexibacter ruber]